MTFVRPETRTYGNPAQANSQPSEPAKLPQGPQVLQPGQQETLFRGYQPGDNTTARDRHIIVSRGTEKSGRRSGVTDPILDGPARPSFVMINRSFRPQAGTDNTRNQDDLKRGYRKSPTGQYVGSQDGSVSRIWGGTPGLWTPYGSYAGYARGPVTGIQSPQEYGSPTDGPQVVLNSPPHGLHSATRYNGEMALSRFSAVAQQKPGRVDRPANSKIAGQSFSQTVQPQSAVQPLAVTHGGSARIVPTLGGSGWRGM